MKKAFIMFSAMLFLLGCGSDSEPVAPSLEAQLSGSWTKGPIRLRYFDVSGKIEFEDTVPYENGMVYTFDRGQIKATGGNGSGFVGIYRILEIDGRQQVQITVGYHTRYRRVVELTADRLVWESDFENLDYLNQDWKTANKALHIEEFAR